MPPGFVRLTFSGSLMAVQSPSSSLATNPTGCAGWSSSPRRAASARHSAAGEQCCAVSERPVTAIPGHAPTHAACCRTGVLQLVKHSLPRHHRRWHTRRVRDPRPCRPPRQQSDAGRTDTRRFLGHVVGWSRPAAPRTGQGLGAYRRGIPRAEPEPMTSAVGDPDLFRRDRLPGQQPLSRNLNEQGT
jgi:hypothetical protein